MDEIDDIWEVDLFGNYSYWVTEEEYDRIKAIMLDDKIDKANTAVVCKTLDGAEVPILLTNICNLSYSTKESRKTSRERNKKYKEEWEPKKEPWEE